MSEKQDDKEKVIKSRWYVVQVATGTENYVQIAITKRIAQEGQEHRFDEILVPTEQVVAMRGGQKRSSDRKFFPSYVLVKMQMDDETWHLIKSVPKVRGFIGGEKPSAITEKEAQRILDRIQEGVDKPRPKVLYEIGEVVRVVEGPFADFNGVVEEVNYEKSRLRVSVMIFGRSTPVELEFGQVEKG
jgi:transcription termination/antitermination protein NusG